MQAVILTGSKQYLVQDNDIINIELAGDAKELTFEPLLVIDGKDVKVGTPIVAGAKVTAEVISEIKGDKVKVLRFKAKKRVKKLTGHRQRYTQIKISKISV